mgnify:CR=1 FL=1
MNSTSSLVKEQYRETFFYLDTSIIPEMKFAFKILFSLFVNTTKSNAKHLIIEQQRNKKNFQKSFSCCF